MSYSDQTEHVLQKIEEWAYNKYGYTPLEFRKACREGELSAHEYWIESGYFDDNELRKMGYTPKTS